MPGIPITESIANDGTARVSFTNADVNDGSRKCSFDIASIHGGDQKCYDAPADEEASDVTSEETSEETSDVTSEETSEEPSDVTSDVTSEEETAPDMDAMIYTPETKDFTFSGAESATRIEVEDTASGLRVTRKGSKSASGNSAIYTKPLAMDGLHIRLENIALANGQTVTIFVNPTANPSQWGFNYGLSLDIRRGNGSFAVSFPDTVEIPTILNGISEIQDAKSLDIVLDKDDAGNWQITINGATAYLGDYDLSFLDPKAVYVGFADGDLNGYDAIAGTYDVTVVHGGDDECLSGASVEDVVAELVKDIEGLPAVDKLTLENESAVMTVSNSFEALADILPDYVDNFDELKATVEAAVKKIADLREAADEADADAIKAVEDLIAAIEIPNANDKEAVAAFEKAINEAKAAFEALREDLQANVENSGDLGYYELLLDGMKVTEDETSEDETSKDETSKDETSKDDTNASTDDNTNADVENPATGVALPVGMALAALLAGGALTVTRRKN